MTRPLAGGLAVLAASMAWCAGSAQAELIRMEHAGVASGTLTLGDGAGMITFADAEFVISAIGDTENRGDLIAFPGSEPHGYEIVHTTASVEIEGVGTFVLHTETRTYAVHTGDGTGRIGLGRTASSGMLDLFNGPEVPESASWDMTSDLSVSSAAGGSVMQWDASPVVTDAGVLFLRYEPSSPWQFTATLMPTPGGVAMLGIAGLVGVRRRR